MSTTAKEKSSGGASNGTMTLLIAFALGMLSAVFFMQAFLPMLLVKEVQSPYPYDRTLMMIEENAIKEGWSVPESWRIDQREFYKESAKVDIGPNYLFHTCAPQLVPSLLKGDYYKYFGAMLPCSISVYRKSDGRIYIATMNLDFLAFAIGGQAKNVLTNVSLTLERITRLH